VDFKEAMVSDPARLVVLHRTTEEGEDQFQWGITGNVPVLSMIGAVVGAQARLVVPDLDVDAPKMSDCPEQALVIAFGNRCKYPSYFCSRSIPTDALVGMLETIKAALVGSRVAQHNTVKSIVTSPLLGPDGQPIKH
jgi:hypothetical protein